MKRTDERYSRQLVMPELGPEAQRKLGKSRVLVVGAGGLGSPVIAYLAAAGVGSVIIAEKDRLEISNLNRQIIYRTADSGGSKAALAGKFAAALNPRVKVEIFGKPAGFEELLKLSKNADLVMDCSDNFETRFNINRACFRNGKTYVFASVYRFEAQLAVFAPRRGACLECVYGAGRKSYLDSSAAGILGGVAGAAGAMAAVEAVKTLCGLKNLESKMAVFDFKNNSSVLIDLKKNRNCPVCASKRRKS